MLIALLIFAIYVIGLLVTLKVYKKFFPRTLKDIVFLTATFWFAVVPINLFNILLTYLYKKI